MFCQRWEKHSCMGHVVNSYLSWVGRCNFWYSSIERSKQDVSPQNSFQLRQSVISQDGIGCNVFSQKISFVFDKALLDVLSNLSFLLKASFRNLWPIFPWPNTGIRASAQGWNTHDMKCQSLASYATPESIQFDQQDLFFYIMSASA